MTQSGPPDAFGGIPNDDPRRVHAAEQAWATTQSQLENVINMFRNAEGDIYQHAQNTDDSVLFDYIKGYIITAENEQGHAGHIMTVIMCAAALTKLVRAPRTTDDPLAQLDWNIGDNPQ